VSKLRSGKEVQGWKNHWILGPGWRRLVFAGTQLQTAEIAGWRHIWLTIRSSPIDLKMDEKLRPKSCSSWVRKGLDTSRLLLPQQTQEDEEKGKERTKTSPTIYIKQAKLLTSHRNRIQQLHLISLNLQEFEPPKIRR